MESTEVLPDVTPIYDASGIPFKNVKRFEVTRDNIVPIANWLGADQLVFDGPDSAILYMRPEGGHIHVGDTLVLSGDRSGKPILESVISPQEFENVREAERNEDRAR